MIATTAIATPATTTTLYGVSDSTRALADPHVLIVLEKRTDTVEISPGSMRELLRADSVKVRGRERERESGNVWRARARRRSGTRSLSHVSPSPPPPSPYKKKTEQAIVSVSSPEAAADALASAVSLKNPQLAAAVRSDVISATAALSSALPLAKSFSAKLEVVTRQSCPKWHSDYVNCRCLVTYAGKGTLFAPPEAVLSEEEARRRTRSRQQQQRAATAAAACDGEEGKENAPAIGGGIPVDEALVFQAEPFDFLFLKGRASAAAVRGAEAAARAAAPRPLRELLGGGRTWGGGGGEQRRRRSFASSLAPRDRGCP